MKTDIATLQSKEQAWEEKRPFKADPNFRWVSMDTRILRPCEMQTSHLFNCLKMIWNNRVPKQYRIEPFREYPEVRRWSRAMVKKAVFNLGGELMNRSDRTQGMNEFIERIYRFINNHILK